MPCTWNTWPRASQSLQRTVYGEWVATQSTLALGEPSVETPPDLALQSLAHHSEVKLVTQLHNLGGWSCVVG